MVKLLLAALSLGTATASSCPPLTPRSTVPVNARDLRIDDFAVIMAMGDSMTAGFNAASKADMKEHRGLSFSIGGDQEATTLPNLINSVKAVKLVGPSLGELSQPQLKATCSGR